MAVNTVAKRSGFVDHPHLLRFRTQSLAQTINLDARRTDLPQPHSMRALAAMLTRVKNPLGGQPCYWGVVLT
jgi:hypothetical protein